MNQFVLPIDLEVKLQENDIAYHIHHLVESIPDEAFAPFYKETGCPIRHLCAKAKEGTNRRLRINLKWEQQKAYVQQKLSEPETAEIYHQREMDVEPVFGFLKAILGFTRLSVREKFKVKIEMEMVLMATN